MQHAETADQLEEERRLLYVAITRAERELHVTGAISATGRARDPTDESLPSAHGLHGRHGRIIGPPR